MKNQKNPEAKNLDKAKAKKVKEQERAKKLKLREREKAKRLKLREQKKAKRERIKAKKLKERAKKLKLREQAKAKKLRERERAKKLKLREKAKLEKQKAKLEKKAPKQKPEKTEKPKKEPKVHEPRNKNKAEAKKILCEAKKSLRASLKSMKSSPLFKGPKVFLDILNGNAYDSGSGWTAKLEDGTVKLDFTASVAIPLSEKFLKSQTQTKGVVPLEQPKDDIDEAIDETCPLPPEVAAILANPPSAEEEPLSADLVPAGDLYGADGKVDEEDLSKMDLDENPEESNENEDDIEDDHPEIPDYRDEHDADLVDARREFYENFSDELEPLDD